MLDFLTIMAAAAPPGGQGGAGLVSTLMPLILIFVVFYFLLIRPQQKKAKDHQKFVDNLEHGMEVITNSGMLGKIVGITRDFVTLEVAPKVKVKFLKNSIAGKAPQAGEEKQS